MLRWARRFSPACRLRFVAIREIEYALGAAEILASRPSYFSVLYDNHVPATPQNNHKVGSGEKNRRKSITKKRAKDFDQKLLSLNDVMMEASQNKNKIDAEQEQKILERARAFCQGRDGRQVP